MQQKTEETTFEHGEEDKCFVHVTYSRQMTSKITNVGNGNDISLFIETRFGILKFY